jgi:hypothetical protein
MLNRKPLFRKLIIPHIVHYIAQDHWHKKSTNISSDVACVIAEIQKFSATWVKTITLRLS